MLLGKKLKKALALFTLISLMPALTVAQEPPGKFSRVLKGSSVSFDAWCFDDIAMAKIKTRLEFSDQRCQLEVGRKLEEQEAKYLLEVGNLETRLKSLQSEYDSILIIKNKEIEKLETAALNSPNDYTVWWATGGFVSGVLATVVIVVAVSK